MNDLFGMFILLKLFFLLLNINFYFILFFNFIMITDKSGKHCVYFKIKDDDEANRKWRVLFILKCTEKYH